MGETTASRVAIPKALLSLVRATSAAGLLAVASAVAVTAGPLDGAPWRRIGLGWRFWMSLGDSGRVLAIGSLIGCLALAALGPSPAELRPGCIRRCVWLNLGTIALSLFVPAIAAL